MGFHVRLAEAVDIPALQALIAASVRTLQASDYSDAQREAALTTVFGVDTQLIADGTYYLVEASSEPVLAGCGGWSFRRTLHGSDNAAERDDTRLDPARDAARIRAFFVRPAWARRGVGSLLLQACEEAAIAAGFRRLELASTLTGVALYQARGYTELARMSVPLTAAEALPIVHMHKHLGA
jgi:GNAT superfamily N-acetyltransferase